MNRTVTATGMQVTARASSSLVISNTLAVGTAITQAFTAGPNELIPATHDIAVTAGTEDLTLATSNLKYNTNPQAVSAASGFKVGTTELTFGNAVNNTPSGSYYFYDYVVYIAAAGGELDTADLTVKLGVTSAINTNLATAAYDTWNACSVDFYVSEDTNTTGTYIGTLNLANTGLTVNATTGLYETDALTLVDDGTIPVNGSTSDYLMVTMRVYFDGALEKSSGQAYVYSNSIATAGIEFSATFTAAD